MSAAALQHSFLVAPRLSLESRRPDEHRFYDSANTEGRIQSAVIQVRNPRTCWNNRDVSSVARAEASQLPQGEILQCKRQGLWEHGTVSRFVAAVKECGRKQDFERGRKLHQEAIETGLHKEEHVVASLITMYSNCRRMQLARQVFDSFANRDVVTWTSLIEGYLNNKQRDAALDLFDRMDCEPNKVTYLAVLKACKCSSGKHFEKQFCLQRGIAIHKRAKKQRFDKDTSVATTLVDMYSNCGSMQRAREVFENTTDRNAGIWNALIMGYVENGEKSVAMDLFTAMDCEKDAITYTAALKACSQGGSHKRAWLEKGIAIHSQVKKLGMDSHVIMASSLISMYSRCSNMQRAREVFESMKLKNVVTWNTLIQGYVENGEFSVALDLFDRMDCQPDYVVDIVALKACAGLASENEAEKQACLEKGIAIHRRAKARGSDSRATVTTALLNMYCKCGSPQLAREVFEGMKSKDVIAWTCLIQGYAENGKSLVALEMFANMDCAPNAVTYLAALKACGNLGALASGQQIHASLCKLGFEQDEVVATSLMDFYGKCANMSRAEELFNNRQCPDTISWNSLITGYSSLGDSAAEVFRLARKMQECGLGMNRVTVLCVLTACSHAGLVEEGKQYFEQVLACGLNVGVEHYTCIVDMLGRANKLDEAVTLIKSMPFEANEFTWTSFLGACKKWNNMEAAKAAFDALVAARFTEASTYVLMREIWEQMDPKPDK